MTGPMDLFILKFVFKQSATPSTNTFMSSQFSVFNNCVTLEAVLLSTYTLYLAAFHNLTFSKMRPSTASHTQPQPVRCHVILCHVTDRRQQLLARWSSSSSCSSIVRRSYYHASGRSPLDGLKSRRVAAPRYTMFSFYYVMQIRERPVTRLPSHAYVYQ
jgi:hypothetical protein